MGDNAHYGSLAPRALRANISHRILMVSDFFYPNFGGVEHHIYHLAQCLMQRGHKVVVMTHAYGERSGVRYMTNGLKVYYVPRLPFYSQNTFPTLFGGFPLLRVVLLRERITVVHAHQAFSCLCHEAILHARTMGYKVVFTDHSLFGFADAPSILTNKLLMFTLADINHVICVSHTSKENTVLRAALPPSRVSVLPNAVDATKFTPDVTARRPNVTIVVVSRLVYRKGADLLVDLIPEVCRTHPGVDFIIGGDGPKRPLLEAMRERHGLQDRVEMLGAVPHARVRDVLVRGHLFLNTSLTEAFCIAILEAAACGLLVVSTCVGGVPEVLPPDMLLLAEPDPRALVAAIGQAIKQLPSTPAEAARQADAAHAAIRRMYSWRDVAARTERVYARVVAAPDDELLTRLRRYYRCGRWAGKVFCCVVAVDYLYWRWLEWRTPASALEAAPDFPYEGDHRHAQQQQQEQQEQQRRQELTIRADVY